MRHTTNEIWYAEQRNAAIARAERAEAERDALRAELADARKQADDDLIAAGDRLNAAQAVNDRLRTELAEVRAELAVLKARVAAFDDLVAIQCRDGNWNTGEYMLGMANGMLLAQAVMKDAEYEPLPAAPADARQEY